MRVAIACRTAGFWSLFRDELVPEGYLRIETRDELSIARLEAAGVEVVFFPHWSWIVPEEILARFECVCFHSAPLPFGRGGSPIQNMIALGKEETEVVALRMVAQLDAGPVFLRSSCSLLGGGEEVMIRIYGTIATMIGTLSRNLPDPVPQEGSATTFRRRSPENSRVPQDATVRALFDHIRMLDVEGYPPAFLDHGGYRFRFTRPALRFGGRIEADVSIERIEEEGGNP